MKTLKEKIQSFPFNLNLPYPAGFFTRWESGRSVNGAINKLKQSYPELKEEYGVRYFPLDLSSY